MRDASHPHTPMQGPLMHLRHLPARALLAVALAAGLSCTDSTAPDPTAERAATDLRLLAAPAGTPPLATTQVSFYAVQGRAVSADIWYRPRAGQADSAKYLEFRMGASSLAQRPDGSAVAPGDSVLITLTVTDQTHFIIDFQPSGLKFSATDQPTLKISFAACGQDLNYDGVVDATDAAMLASLSFWRQEGPFQPWFKLSSTVTATTEEVTASLTGFTGYALMW